MPIVGGFAGVAFALVFGWVTTKKAATPFAMITLGIGELVYAMSLMFPEFFGGEGGVSGNRVAGSSPLGITYGPQIQLYYLIAEIQIPINFLAVVAFDQMHHDHLQLVQCIWMGIAANPAGK
mgnify:CR=1 FL=1